MTTTDDLKLIEAVLKHARRLGLAYKYGWLTTEVNEALDAVARVHKDIQGRQLEPWGERGDSDGT